MMLANNKLARYTTRYIAAIFRSLPIPLVFKIYVLANMGKTYWPNVVVPQDTI